MTNWKSSTLLGAALPVAVASGLAVAHPNPGVRALIPALIVLAWASVRPARLLVLTLLAVIFGPTVNQVAGVPFAQSADEALLLAFTVVAAWSRLTRGLRLRRFPGTLWFVLFALAGTLSSLTAGVPLETMGVGGLLLIKGVVLGWGAAQLDWESMAAPTYRFAVVMGTLLIAAGVLNVVAAATFNQWFSAGGYDVAARAGFPAVIGWFKHPSFFAQTAGLAAVALFAFRREMGRGGRVLTIALAVLSALSLRRKSWVSVPAGLLGALAARSKLAAVSLALVGALGGWLVGGTQIQSVVDETVTGLSDDDAPRVILYRGAVDIAQEKTPLGAGFGRWGSAPSVGEDYSPEYVSRGLNLVDGFEVAGEREFTYATDTFWPIIIGETGWIGLALYALGLLAMIRLFRREVNAEDPWRRTLGVTGIGWAILLLVESTAAPVLTGPPTFPWIFVLAGALASIRQDDAPRATQGEMKSGGRVDGRVVSE